MDQLLALQQQAQLDGAAGGGTARPGLPQPLQRRIAPAGAAAMGQQQQQQQHQQSLPNAYANHGAAPSAAAAMAAQMRQRQQGMHNGGVYQQMSGQPQQQQYPGTTGVPKAPSAAGPTAAGTPGNGESDDFDDDAMVAMGLTKVGRPGAGKGGGKGNDDDDDGDDGVPAAKKRPAPPGGGQGSAKQLRPSMGEGDATVAVGGAVAGTTAPPATSDTAGADSGYVCFTRGNDNDDVVVSALVGEYSEVGINHGKKVYRKMQNSAEPGAADVWMYYWDERDGPASRGWWFGNEVGGMQAWSFCPSNNPSPPESGWQIPWNGPVKQTLALSPKAQPKAQPEQQQQQQEQQQPEQQQPTKQPIDVRQLSEDMRCAILAANAALAQANAAEETYLASGQSEDTQGIRQGERVLSSHIPPLKEIGQKMEEARRTSTQDVLVVLSSMGAQLRTILNDVNTKLVNMRLVRRRADEERQKVQDEKDRVILNSMTAECRGKMTMAEDLLEKTTITAEVLSVVGDLSQMRNENGDTKSTLEHTEAAAREAQHSISEAQASLRKLSDAANTFGEKVKTQATNELNKMQKQLREAQTKLNPMKFLRQDQEQRKVAQRVIMEITPVVTDVETTLGNAEESVLKLSLSNRNSQDVFVAQAAIAKAQTCASTAFTTLERRQAETQGVIHEEVAKLSPKVKAARERITQLKVIFKEIEERIVCTALLLETEEKLKDVMHAIAKTDEMEAGLPHCDEVNSEEALAGIKSLEAAVVSTQSKSVMARIFISSKLVEVRRFVSVHGSDATAQLKSFHEQLEAANMRIKDLENKIGEQKQAALVWDIERQVGETEAHVERVEEDAMVFLDSLALTRLSHPEICRLTKKAVVTEKDASKAIEKARQFITAQHVEAKGKTINPEFTTLLAKFQARVVKAEGRVAQIKSSFTSAEERVRAKRVSEEAMMKMKKAEDEQAKVSDLVERMVDFEDVDSAELVANAHVALQELHNFIEEHTKTSTIGRDVLAKLNSQAAETRERVLEAQDKIRKHSEKATSRNILEEVEAKVIEMDEVVARALEASRPNFEAELSGVDMLHPDAAVTAFVAIVQEARDVVNATRRLIAMKNLASKRFCEEAKHITAEGLSMLQSRVERASADVSKLRGGVSDRYFGEQGKQQQQGDVQEQPVNNIEPNDEQPEALKEQDGPKNGSSKGSDKHVGSKGGKGEYGKGWKKSNLGNGTPQRWQQNWGW